MSELHDALERFCIMAEQSDVGDEKAFIYIKGIYGIEIAKEVWEMTVHEGKSIRK